MRVYAGLVRGGGGEGVKDVALVVTVASKVEIAAYFLGESGKASDAKNWVVTSCEMPSGAAAVSSGSC